jgi:UDP-N-acetylmuramoylalanine--D-glutamate ligase
VKIAILGFSREGHSVLKFLQNRGMARTKTRNGADKNEIWVLDKNRRKLPRGVKAVFGKNYLKNLGWFDIIFRSPGVPYSLPQIQRAKKHGVEISSATKLFFEQFRGLTRTGRGRSRKVDAPVVVGITGTKGKGTTATLLYKMLKAARKNTYLAGNIGTPALDLLSKPYTLAPKPYIVLELSSFQLQDLETSPHTAVILDIFPDHLDAHKSLAEYYDAKANIARYQKKNDIVFFSAHNAVSRRIARKSPGEKIAVDEKRFKLFSPSDVRIPGAHNFKNAVIAATIAQHLGVPAAAIRRVVQSFRGNEHRLEFVRKLTLINTDLTQRYAEKNRPRSSASSPRKSAIKFVEFYNDSASTIPQPTAAALRAFPGVPKILIAGGRAKVHDYTPIRNALNAETKLIVLMGENKREMKRALAGKGNKIVFAKTLKEAVRLAYREARALLATHRSSLITILFSPASASFDMFENYAERGKQFKKLVQQLR